MVKAGNGAYRVGNPEEKIPVHAGISKHSPAETTSRRDFIPAVSALRGYCFKSACKVSCDDAVTVANPSCDRSGLGMLCGVVVQAGKNWFLNPTGSSGVKITETGQGTFSM